MFSKTFISLETEVAENLWRNAPLLLLRGKMIAPDIFKVFSEKLKKNTVIESSNTSYLFKAKSGKPKF